VVVPGVLELTEPRRIPIEVSSDARALTTSAEKQ
jgi:hypothetical protein